MLNILPTEAWPFIFAVIAAGAAAFLGRHRHGEPLGIASVMLYAVAIGCVIIGVVTTWLQHAA